MSDFVYYIPVFTTVLSSVFASVVFRRYRSKPGATYLLWWSAGILLFGVGTFMEGFTAIFGWHEPVFRAWYISGALLGGAPLAQGTVYLLLNKRTADRMAIALVAFIALASLMVLLTPVNAALADDKKLSGDVIDWTWVRAFSPFINLYAFIFLVGGAAYSALKYREQGGAAGRAWGNGLICIGALLPGIGGTFTRMGYTEVLYVTEFIGIILIYFGYRLNVGGRPAAVARASTVAESTARA